MDSPASKKPSKKMTEKELLALIAQLEQSALGSSVSSGATISTLIPNQQQMTTLEVDRYNSLNLYFARPLGNEVEDRSQVVLPEVRDTVEWIMPQLMRIFAAKSICRFEPEGPNDMDQAEMETQVINHVVMKDNNGLIILHDLFKDALILRNGYAKVTWVKKKVTSLENYSGLTEDEVAKLLQEKRGVEIEVLEQREYPMIEHPRVEDAMQNGAPPPVGPPPQAPPGTGEAGAAPAAVAPPQGPMPMGGAPGAAAAPPPTLFDIKIRRVEEKGRVQIEAVPCEDIRVSPRTRGTLEECPFAQHISQTSRSDLVAEGYDRATVDSIPEGRPNWLGMVELARDQVVEQTNVEDPADFAMRQVEDRENYLNVDWDGDGIAELRRVRIGGDKILDNEEIEETALVSVVPKRMPHRHTGQSITDELGDLQVIKTQLFRQGLDNLYQANNIRTAVDWQNCNLEDLLTSRPGGVVRGKGPPANWIAPLVAPSNLVEQVIPAIEYIDSLREMRTGVGRSSMGLDADELQDVTKGAALAARSAASLKIEMIARMLAEGVKDLFSKVHNCIVRHQDQEFDFEISGKWVKIDPTSWRRRTKVTPNVGLGSGNREEARTNLMLMASAQEKLMAFGLVGPKQGYNTFRNLCETLGYENPQQFAMDPTSPEYQQHVKDMQQSAQNAPPAPQVQAAQIRGQTVQVQEQAQTQRQLLQAKVDLTKAQTDAVNEHALADKQTAHEVMQGENDRQVSLASLQSQEGLAILKMIATIVASQLKQDPGADGGAILKRDYQEVRGSV